MLVIEAIYYLHTSLSNSYISPSRLYTLKKRCTSITVWRTWSLWVMAQSPTCCLPSASRGTWPRSRSSSTKVLSAPRLGKQCFFCWTLSMPCFSVSIIIWCIFAPVALRGTNQNLAYIFTTLRGQRAVLGWFVVQINKKRLCYCIETLSAITRGVLM